MLCKSKTIYEVNLLNNFIIHRYVGKYMSYKELQEYRKENFTRVYITNFGEELTVEKLKDMFKGCGIITSCRVSTYLPYSALLSATCQ